MDDDFKQDPRQIPQDEDNQEAGQQDPALSDEERLKALEGERGAGDLPTHAAEEELHTDLESTKDLVGDEEDIIATQEKEEGKKG